MLLPQTVAELMRLGLSPRGVALDGGFNTGPTNDALARLDPDRVFISGRQQPGSPAHPAPPAAVPHRRRGPHQPPLKRRYSMRRSRLKGDQGQRIWTAWGTLAYNVDTYTRLT
jgi:hypothetical protein